jgi:hypothetical protein
MKSRGRASQQALECRLTRQPPQLTHGPVFSRVVASSLTLDHRHRERRSEPLREEPYRQINSKSPPRTNASIPAPWVKLMRLNMARMLPAKKSR